MMLDGLRCSETLFRSTEVTKIVGMHPDMLRLWRSRGHLPKKTGRGLVYTGREIAEIMVRYELSNYGISPAKTVTIAKNAAPSVIQMALISFPTACEVAGPKDKVDALKEFHAGADALATYLSGEQKPVQFVVRRDREDPELVNDAPAVIDEGRFKTAMVLSLQMCSQIIVEGAGRPLFRCEYAETEDQPFILDTLESG